METRNITVVSTRDQKRSVISTDATTLGELKAALRRSGIDYEGMTFYEGLTHSEYNVDNAVLPHDVEYKGTTTNELVFMLTNSNKKIKSGALSEARAALYATIEERNLAAVCMEKFGKNMTNCSNAELLQVVEDSEPTPAASEACPNVAAALDKLVDFLYESDYLFRSEVDEIKDILFHGAPRVASPYTDDEISDMFAGVEA